MAGEPEKRDSSPLVSVVIPTYDRNDRLTGAVRSVTDQTYENIELFIVDDGSPVPVSLTLDVDSLDELERVTFIRHRENRGANVARNNGIRAARGEYIAFLDDDDRWDATKIDRQVDVFENSAPEVGVVYTGLRARSEEGETITKPTAEGNVMIDLLTGETFGQFSSVMVRTDVLEDVGLPDERFPAWQDREWFFRLARRCHFKPIPEPLTYRRTGLPDSITADFEQKRDVAYPLFVDKHYQKTREFGLYYARTFLASLRRTVGHSAVLAGEYREARKYFFLSVCANPLYRPAYMYLLASLGGKPTYEAAARLRRKAKSLVSKFD